MLSAMVSNKAKDAIMMEVVGGLPRDVVSLIWHQMSSGDDIRANLTPQERDQRAGPHDVRLFAKVKSLDSSPPRRSTLDDLPSGVGEWSQFGRIAVVTDEPLYRHVIQFFGPFFHGPIHVFTNAQSVQARQWLEGRPIR
jgi:hypothetical protein